LTDDQEDQDVTRWTVHGRRAMYESDWVNVYLDDVELPDGHHIDHHVLTFPKASQTAVVLNDARDHVLLIWRHRYITDTWGWEVPAGWVEPGEDPEASIRREIEEETGYHVGHIEPMVSYNAISGISTMRFTAYSATAARPAARPADKTEASRIQWHSLSNIPNLAGRGELQDGPSLTALLVYLGLRSQLTA
jgi:8-oxo-dGTP pyrophosphatase MutT (NUDIX family)